MAKLTLSLDREVIEQAKRLAAERGTSVSAMFSAFIRTLGAATSRNRPIGKLTRQASGVIDLKGQDYKDVLTDSLREKYRL